MQAFYTGWIRAEEDRATKAAESSTNGLLKTVWRYGWGLAFVVAMALLSEFGPHTIYSKVASTMDSSTQTVLHGIK